MKLVPGDILKHIVMLLTLGVLCVVASSCVDRIPFGTLVPGSGVIPVPPGNASVIDRIETMNGWKAYTGGVSTCPSYDPYCSAGQSVANYSPQQTVPSPLYLPGTDGIVGLFELLPSPSWADLLYGRSLGNYSWASNFIWDFWINLSTTSLGSLEFDIWKSLSSVHYMIGSQCSYNNKTWDGWDEASQHWIHINPAPENNFLSCDRFSPDQWHHIVWYVTQTNGMYNYVSLEVDGVGHYINLPPFRPSTMSWGDGIGVQVQIDADRYGSPVREYIDKMSLTVW